MSNIILGTVQFGLDYGINNALGKTPISEVHRILNYVYSKGIKTLDTASGLWRFGRNYWRLFSF